MRSLAGRLVFFVFIISFSLAPNFTKANDVDKKCDSVSSQTLDKSQIAEIEATEELNIQSSKLHFDNKKPVEYTINLETNGQKLPIKVYRYLSVKKPSKGTVVFLCGGPSACMDYGHGRVPSDYDVIKSDYIGLGKNSLAPAPIEMISIEGQGLVVKKIIEALKLSEYVIHGESFGTIVATVAADLIGNDHEMKQPKSIILEGTVPDHVMQDFPSASNKAFSLFDSSMQKKLSEAYRKLTASESKEDIAALNFHLTVSLGRGPEVAANEFFRIMSGDFKKIKKSFRKNDKYDNHNLRIFSSAMCQAFDSEVKNNQKVGKLFGGLFENPYYEIVNFCSCQTVKRKYNPVNFKIRAPILYVNGDTDPFTPLEGAKRHMNSQKVSSSKTMIVVKDEGHWPIAYKLSECANLIYSSAMSGDFKKFAVPNDYLKNCNNSKLHDSNPIVVTPQPLKTSE